MSLLVDQLSAQLGPDGSMVIGPGTGVDNEIITFDGTSGVDIQASGISIVSGTIFKTSDSNTKINLNTADRIIFEAGGLEFLTLQEGTTDVVKVNPQTGDINFRVDANGVGNILFVDAGNIDVSIGSTALSGTGLFNIDGLADEPQLFVQAHSTQTSDIVIVENSSGTDLFRVQLTKIKLDANTDLAAGKTLGLGDDAKIDFLNQMLLYFDGSDLLFENKTDATNIVFDDSSLDLTGNNQVVFIAGGTGVYTTLTKPGLAPHTGTNQWVARTPSKASGVIPIKYDHVSSNISETVQNTWQTILTHTIAADAESTEQTYMFDAHGSWVGSTNTEFRIAFDGIAVCTFTGVAAASASWFMFGNIAIHVEGASGDVHCHIFGHAGRTTDDAHGDKLDVDFTSAVVITFDMRYTSAAGTSVQCDGGSLRVA